MNKLKHEEVVENIGVEIAHQLKNITGELQDLNKYLSRIANEKKNIREGY